MSSFDSDNDFLQEDYYETNGNFYAANGVYQGLLIIFAYINEQKFKENGGNLHDFLYYEVISTFILSRWEIHLLLRIVSFIKRTRSLWRK